MKLSKYIDKPIEDSVYVSNEYHILDNEKNVIEISNINSRIKYLNCYNNDGLLGSTKKCFVRYEIYEKLLNILSKLDDDYQLFVFDAYRTLKTQKDIYYVVKNKVDNKEIVLDDSIEKYVSKPELNLNRPPAHLTGAAIDLAIAKNFKILEYGTEFDEFVKYSRTSYFENENEKDKYIKKYNFDETFFKEIKENRRLLFNLMIEEGFVNLPSEWWHYEYKTALWADIKKDVPKYGYLKLPDELLYS